MQVLSTWCNCPRSACFIDIIFILAQDKGNPEGKKNITGPMDGSYLRNTLTAILQSSSFHKEYNHNNLTV